MRATRTRRSLSGLTALAIGCTLALAACGDDEPEDQGDGSSEVAEEPEPVSPLTGLPLKNGKHPRHPVLAVKVDNSASSAPQVGLGSADMVAEELVEGGFTRLAAFFYTDVPDDVGPVRSMRATDIGIVKPLDAVLVASGGAPQTVQRVEEAGITTVTEGAPGYYREGSRPAPYNLFMRLGELAPTLKADGHPVPYLPFGDPEDFPRGRPASSVTATFSARSATTFEYDGGTWSQVGGYAGEGDRYQPETIVVLRVEIGDAGYLDPSGATVPETVFTGRGQAVVLHGGRAVRATWVKDGLDAPIGLVARGEELSIPPGKVWLGLVPRDDGEVAVSE
jgi:hypothetical protein